MRFLCSSDLVKQSAFYLPCRLTSEHYSSRWRKASVILCCACLMVCIALGEEVVTRESFISICWRLIPYWLNNWEQQWGAECSSMMVGTKQI